MRRCEALACATSPRYKGGVRTSVRPKGPSPAELTIFRLLVASVAEEMGAVLQRAAFSPNIKERRDFSCAVFDPDGELVAQAAHIPVHLGAASLSVKAVTRAVALGPGDAALVNDPYAGGTHLPDLTLVSPVFLGRTRVGYVANRAHHADIGGEGPASMALASSVEQEGIRIPPTRILRRGRLLGGTVKRLFGALPTFDERVGDLEAQLAANAIGATRLSALVERIGLRSFRASCDAQNAYAERLMRDAVARLPRGRFSFEDLLDDDGLGRVGLAIRCTVARSRAGLTLDFTGTSPQVSGPLNCVMPITLAAVAYAVRCLVPADAPECAGMLRPLKVIAPQGTLVNALPPAAVAGGNVETSQRITDVVLGALAQADPGRMAAASQGTMNNVAIAGVDPRSGRAFAYYETLGGGEGASRDHPGASAIQLHMTNTLNTPAEVIERAYPLRIDALAVRRGSGGEGAFRGGDGLLRCYRFLAPARVALLTERRRRGPWGLAGGGAGKPGRNVLVRDGRPRVLPGKCELDVLPGDVLRIEAPGGGGYGPRR
ncbi:MAG: hydantoinase B/oxoprolinase family protein [Myxococcales bacterium]